MRGMFWGMQLKGDEMNAMKELTASGGSALGQCLIVTGSEPSLLGGQLRRMLEARGFSVLQADTADEALRICWRNTPRVVFVPQQPEGPGGARLLRRLRQMPRPAECPVLVYAENADPARIGRMIWEGADDCIVQPVNPEILEAKLRQAGVL